MSHPESPTASQEGRQRVTKKLPTFRVGFTKQLDALRAYALLSDNGSKAVHYSRVAETIKVHEANVSSMNPFFLENGFVEKNGSGYTPTAPVLEYARQHSWSAENAAQKLYPIIAETWFGQALSQRLHFRSMSDEEAIELLAARCSAGPEAKPQLRMLLEYVESSGVAARVNGQLQAVVPTRPDSSDGWQPQPTQAPTPPSEEINNNSAPKTETARNDGGAISFQCSIDVSMSEMQAWSPDRIASFFSGLAQVLAAKNG